MNSAKSLDQFVATAGIFLYAILLGIVITLNPRTGYVFALLPMFAWVILQRQNAILVLLLMLLPFHASPSLAQNIMVSLMFPKTMTAASMAQCACDKPSQIATMSRLFKS